MTSESSPRYRSLSNSLYETAIERLQASLSVSLGALLNHCQLGVAPGADRHHMLFMIVADCSQVDQLAERIEAIAQHVEQWMPSVARIALCLRPADDPHDGDRNTTQPRVPSQVMGRIFELGAREE